MWGSRESRHPYGYARRSIPTCVGQPPATLRQRTQTWVYPHVCGAAYSRRDHLDIGTGLSPRVWGSLPSVIPFLVFHRSIPTCVGQPLYRAIKHRATRVYPHVCGAAAQLACGRKSRVGLSPRVWGSRESIGGQQGFTRSIPTCVGQPVRVLVPATLLSVYPHVCGAALSPSEQWQQCGGLSPRVWGSLQKVEMMLTAKRSIPTCVGQPVTIGLVISLSWVYPHVCGAASTTSRSRS